MSGPRIRDAARRIAAGEVIAFPTETVYGLGTDATNPRAVARIFALKGRPAHHPLIVHIADPEALPEWVSDIPREATALSACFWPGPLTMILKKSDRVPPSVTGGQDSVGIRCPSHPVARELFAELARIGGGAVAAPSANKFGHVSPTTAQHVRDEFGPDLHILDGGVCEVGLESTIVDLSRGGPALLRPGRISRKQIEEALGIKLRDRDGDVPRASGTLAAHYAPRTALALVDGATLQGELLQAEVAVLALGASPATARVHSWISGTSDPERYGHDLYANLRKLDASGARRIVVEAPPKTPPWEAVNDRLTRAAAGAGAMDDEP